MDQCFSKRLILFSVMALLCTCPFSAAAQSGLYVPSTKPIKNMQKALTNPPVFHLLLHYDDDSIEYSVADLDLLDSAYNIAFDLKNPMYYTMTIEGYGSSDTVLTEQRVDAVYRYFAQRTHAIFPIRHALNPIHCSCNGDTVEVLRFEVPTNLAVYDCADLQPSRLQLNGSVPLAGSVLVTFRNDPDACVGTARGCFVPSEDSLVYGYYASLLIAKGAVYSVANTKDTCPSGFDVKIEDHLDYKQTVEQYHLIPHRRQILAQAGYIVVKSDWKADTAECSQPQKDSIFIRIPATPEQLEAKLKFFAKVKTTRGMEYKQLPTRKAPGKGELMLQAPINITQFDTIYVGKRLQDKEVSKYFYPVDGPTEAASFRVGDKYYVAYRMGKHGQYELKKPLKALFRIVPDQEEDIAPSDGKSEDPEEIIE